MLVGRGKEQAALDGLLDAARAGQSGALVIRGGPGIGKSSLLDYAADRAGGMRVLRCTGIESESEIAFAALHLLLRPGLGLLDALAEPQADALRGALGLAHGSGDDRFLVGLAALSLLAELAGEGALLCLVDDAQFLDRSSADALMFAARRLDAEGVVVLFATRETGMTATHGLPEVTLTGLTRDASAALLDAVKPGLPAAARDRVLTYAAGNPLALLELPTIGAQAPALGNQPLPQRIQDAFHDQVVRLSPRVQLMLLVAASDDVGDLMTVLRAATTLGVPASAADEAERSGLVSTTDFTVTFRHPLVRAAIYQGATFGEREAVHRALASSLTGENDSDRRAWHLAAAATGPDDDIAAELERTALRARERRGYAAAAAALERAARLTPDQGTRAKRLLAAAGSAFDGGLPVIAGVLADEAGLSDAPWSVAPIAMLRAKVAAGRGATRAAHGILVAASDAVAHTDPDSNVLMLVEALRAAWFIGDRALLAAASSRLRTAPAPSPALAPLVSAGLALDDLACGQVARAQPALASLVAFGRQLPDGDPDTRSNTAGAALIIGDFEAAQEIGRTAERECRVAGMIGRLPAIQQVLALAQTFLNRFDDATASATEGIRLAIDTDQPYHVAHLKAVLALLAAYAGDETQCRRLSADALAYFAVDGVSNGATVAQWAVATLDLGRGRYETALDRMEMVALGPARHQMDATYYAPDQIEAAMRLGRPHRAREPLERFATWADAVELTWPRAVLHRCHALTAPDTRAEEHYTAALQLHADGIRPVEHGRTEMLYAEWLRRTRRQSDARRHLRHALMRFEQAGARPWADRARAELRAAGDTVAATDRPAPDLLDQLTPQERQVVRLTATGATNRDIAAQLFLSPRTVSHHLYRAFPKLGVTTRTELARLLSLANA